MDKKIPLYSEIPGQWLHEIPESQKHGGIMARVELPEPVDLSFFSPDKGPLVILDELTDPHNVGALWRSAAAFGVQGIILTKHNTPRLQGVVAKTSAGAMDCVPYHQGTNLARTLKALKDKGFFIVGLQESSERDFYNTPLEELDLSPVALIIGSEGKGLRPLTRQYCDHLVFISCHPRWNVLNASIAGALAMHHVYQAFSKHAAPLACQ